MFKLKFEKRRKDMKFFNFGRDGWSHGVYLDNWSFLHLLFGFLFASFSFFLNLPFLKALLIIFIAIILYELFEMYVLSVIEAWQNSVLDVVLALSSFFIFNFLFSDISFFGNKLFFLVILLLILVLDLLAYSSYKKRGYFEKKREFKYFNFFKQKRGRDENFWLSLRNKKKEGFSILAPMADVTDNAFRRIINEVGRPDVFFTEFAACDGLNHPKGLERIKNSILTFEKDQKIIVAQIFGGRADNYEKAARICKELGFNGIDINMGCPQKNIMKQKSGAELINHPNLVSEIYKKTVFGAGGLPVSIKTRLGFNKIDLDWIKHVLSLRPAALTIHLRTRKEMSKVPAHFEMIEKINLLRNKISPNTVLIVNGDIKSLKQGREILKISGADGIMIGRGIFENPLLFAGSEFSKLVKKEKLSILLRHLRYFEEEFGTTKRNLKKFGGRLRSFALMKKFFKIYVNSFSGAPELRNKLMSFNGKEEVESYINKHELVD